MFIIIPDSAEPGAPPRPLSPSLPTAAATHESVTQQEATESEYKQPNSVSMY